MKFFNNPEFVRNARIQLRKGRVFSAIVVCSALSGTIWASIVHADVDFSIGSLRRAGAVFAFTLCMQIAILLIGGGIYVVQSVHREMEQNTFDFQRVTRLSALELACGKLFGSPVGAYFVTLCFMPLSLVGAIRGHVPARLVAEAYVILLLGSIAFHSLALLISVIEGRGAGPVGILVYLFAVVITLVPPAIWAVRQVSPFVAVELVDHDSNVFTLKDEFFGFGVSHFLVLIALYFAFTAWFLLPVVRNIKRDPSLYQIYSGLQALGFALFMSLLQIGFYPWKAVFFQGIISVRLAEVSATVRHDALPTLPVEQFHLLCSMIVMAVMTLALLRSREVVRIRVQSLGKLALSVWAAAWPAPYVVVGVTLVGGSVAILISHYRYPDEFWSWPLVAYDVGYVVAWLTRDVLFVQCMNLRRVRRPLRSAVLYVVIFYGCTATLFSALDIYAYARNAALTAFLVPSPLYALSPSNWSTAKAIWILALVAQSIEACFFWWLHRQRLKEFQEEAPKRLIAKELQTASA